MIVVAQRFPDVACIMQGATPFVNLTVAWVPKGARFQIDIA
jgi:hypothetical protein